MCCPGNMTFFPKGPACPKTCRYPDGDPNCPTKYVDGCQCPPGLVQDITENGDIFCIRPDECNVCKFEGKVFVKGEKIRYKCKEWYVHGFFVLCNSELSFCQMYVCCLV